MTGRWWRQQKARPPAPSAHRRQPKTPVDRTAEKRFYGNPGDHVRRPDNQLRLTSAAAPLSALPSAPPPPAPAFFAPPRPSAESLRMRTASGARSRSFALPGEATGRCGWLELSWLAEGGARRARTPRTARAPIAGDAPERKREVRAPGCGLLPGWAVLRKRRTQRRPSLPVRIRDVEEHGVVGPVPEGGRG